MDFAHITYKNKQYPIRVSYFAMKHFQAATGKNIEELTSNDISAYEHLLYPAMQAGAKYCDTTLELKPEDMEYVLDECLFEFIELIPRFFEVTKKKKELNPAKP
jgi:hypothetical protein